MEAAASIPLGPPTPLEELIGEPVLAERGVRVWIKRDDLIHPAIPGNKYRKLKYNLETAKRQGHSALLTFGGAFSNHIYATAQAGKLSGLRTVGVIRGEEHLPLNPVLSAAKEAGMTLIYLDRDTYRNKRDPQLLRRLEGAHGPFYLVPEGGSNSLGVRGAAEIIEEIDIDFDLITSAVGTGGTLAGLIAGLDDRAEAVGFAVLKGGSFLREEVKALLEDVGRPDADMWRIECDYHFGGYARVRPELMEFIDRFQSDHGIQLDPIYTGKMMFGLLDLVRSGAIPPESRVVALHTGGVPPAHWSQLVG